MLWLTIILARAAASTIMDVKPADATVLHGGELKPRRTERRLRESQHSYTDLRDQGLERTPPGASHARATRAHTRFRGSGPAGQHGKGQQASSSQPVAMQNEAADDAESSPKPPVNPYREGPRSRGVNWFWLCCIAAVLNVGVVMCCCNGVDDRDGGTMPIALRRAHWISSPCVLALICNHLSSGIGEGDLWDRYPQGRGFMQQYARWFAGQEQRVRDRRKKEMAREDRECA